MGDKVPADAVELPVGAVARGTVVAPPSKSQAIRALICAALSGGFGGEPAPTTRIRFSRGPLPEDVLAAVSALRGLGFRIEEGDGPELVVTGAAGQIPLSSATIDVGGSATALRFLAAVCALGAGPYTLTGSPQLLRRPTGAVVPALRALGARVTGSGADGAHPPLVVSGGPISGGEVTIDASESSHVVSGLLLVAPLLPRGLRLRAGGAVASRPYLELTKETMVCYSAEVEDMEDGWLVRPNDGYERRGYELLSTHAFVVDGDWSAAAFLLGAAAATGGDVVVDRLGHKSSLQADFRIVQVLADFGADPRYEGRLEARCRGRLSRPVDVNLRDAPDLAPLVGALACLVPGTSRVRGAAHLRIKETDRIAEVVRCARAWGCGARELPDGFEIDGGRPRGATIDPAGDHRLAMAFAVAGLAVPGTRIAEPECVAKSYPAFWQDLAALTGSPPLVGADPPEPA